MSRPPRRRTVLTRLLEKPAFRWLMVVYVGLALVAMAFTFITDSLNRVRFSNEVIRDAHDAQNLQLSMLAERLDHAENLVTSCLSVSEELVQRDLAAAETPQSVDVSVLSRLEKVESSLENLDQSLNDLRSILNPTNAEEVLTVLRLGDKFEFFENALSRLEGDLSRVHEEVDEQISLNYQNTSELVEGARDTVRWLAVLLVPPLFSALLVFFPRRLTRDADTDPSESSDTAAR